MLFKIKNETEKYILLNNLLLSVWWMLFIKEKIGKKLSNAYLIVREVLRLKREGSLIKKKMIKFFDSLQSLRRFSIFDKYLCFHRRFSS